MERPFYKCPAIFSQHNGTLFALVSLFCGGNILVKSLSLLIGHCPETFWEEVCNSLRNAILKTSYIPQFFLGLYKITHHITIILCLMIPPPPPKKKKLAETFFSDFHAAFPLHLVDL
jgi:hypothetical protein